MQPHRTSNEDRSKRLISLLTPVLVQIPVEQIRRAPYAIQAEIPDAQHRGLISHAQELRAPPGSVIGRRINTVEGHTVEILIGWERLQAFLHREAFPRTKTLTIGLIDCNTAEAAFYAIEYAAKDHQASGFTSTPLLYAAAAQTALEHFGEEDQPWSIQTLANALSIARPTLSNRLRLLKGLAPKSRQLLQQGLIKPEMAKILLAEHSLERQEHLAALAAKGMMSTRALYKLGY